MTDHTIAAKAIISIHSLRVEGDMVPVILPPDSGNFNPLPPCGGRQVERADQLYRAPFQSTPSVWRETDEAIAAVAAQRAFQSTPSVWRETAAC